MSQPLKKRKLNDSNAKLQKDQASIQNQTVKPTESTESKSLASDTLQFEHVDKTFKDLGVIDQLCEACTSLGFKTPRPIQVESIPHALKGKDLIGLAPTGSGKTAAFGLPILQALMYKPSHYFGLVLAPTRELAQQIKTHIEALGSVINVRCVLIIGGSGSSSMMEQAKALQKNPHIIIATPGRLLDHLKNTKGFHLRNLKYLVLDEADKLLDLGFLDSITDILKVLPHDRHTCLFSATMTDKVGKLQRASLKDPVLVSVVTAQKTVQGLIEQWSLVPAKYKDHALFYILQVLHKPHRTIIFCRRIQKVQELAALLRTLAISAIPIHSKLRQDQRSAALNAFARGDRAVLVATDLASRGLDIAAVDMVVNYNVPERDTYVHRVGRTARAGRAGNALTLVDQYEVMEFLKIEQFLGRELQQLPLPKDEYVLLAAAVDEAQIVARREVRLAEEKTKSRGAKTFGKRDQRGGKRDDRDEDEG